MHSIQNNNDSNNYYEAGLDNFPKNKIFSLRFRNRTEGRFTLKTVFFFGTEGDEPNITIPEKLPIITTFFSAARTTISLNCSLLKYTIHLYFKVNLTILDVFI